jgi:hypothetical protein
MSIITRTPNSSPPQADADTATIADHAGRRGRYLTDGVDLYRYLGTVSSRSGRMVGLEDCRSLDVLLLSVRELRRRRMRAVIPAEADVSD